MGEIIYEKHFHKETIEELKKERKNRPRRSLRGRCKASTFIQRNHEKDL